MENSTGDSDLVKTVTFSFNSPNYIGEAETETFTLDQLGIDLNLDKKEIEAELQRLLEMWIWHKLNISCSMVWDL
ncbi:hypothetical protein NCCP2222_13130 [Sporosarcina sp. NCCP-2222]|nr:hypothetical protein NCCP2222_13130 [Sporosarcina sp. NCCP-2222]